MRTSVLTFILGSSLMLVFYNNCSAVHDGSSSLSSSQACNLLYKDEFLRGYGPFLKNNCASCHSFQGTGNGAFADSDDDIAFEAFVVRGNNLVRQRALNPQHQPPFTGAQHTATLTEIDNTWNAIKAQVDLCIAASGGEPSTVSNGILADDPVPTQGTVTTFLKLIEAGPSSRTLSWNLESEIASPRGLSLTGAQFQIDVQATTTLNGEKTYIFSKPRLTAGSDPLHMMYIEFVINNELVQSATSYHSVNRRVPAGGEREAAVGSIAVAYDLRSTDTIAISFGLLDVIDFNPPTFAELIAPTGVFGTHCLGCHNGASGTPKGNFDISSRDNVLQRLMVAPYSPNNSEIFKRMNDPLSPMPQSGLLPQNEIDRVLHWIQDGAR